MAFDLSPAWIRLASSGRENNVCLFFFSNQQKTPPSFPRSNHNLNLESLKSILPAQVNLLRNIHDSVQSFRHVRRDFTSGGILSF